MGIWVWCRAKIDLHEFPHAIELVGVVHIVTYEFHVPMSKHIEVKHVGL